MHVFLLVCVRVCARACVLNQLGSVDFCMQFAVNETEGALCTHVILGDAFVKET